MERRKSPDPSKTGPAHYWTKTKLEQVELLSLLGASNDQIAIFFKVKKVTVELWMKNDEDFAEARKRGGMVADMKVAASLYKRATGFDYEETKAIRTKAGDFITEVTKKKMVPDTKAIIHWLRVKQREAWAVTDEINMNHRVSGKVQHLHEQLRTIPIDELTPAAQEAIFEITSKQLEIAEEND